MQVLTGTKREITIMLWQEQLEKYAKRLNDSMECFRRFHEDSDVEHIAEDAKKIAEIAEQTKKVICHMDLLGME